MRFGYVITSNTKAADVVSDSPGYALFCSNGGVVGTIEELKEKISSWNSDFNWMDFPDGRHEAYFDWQDPFYLIRIILRPTTFNSEGVAHDELSSFQVVIKCVPESYETAERLVSDFVAGHGWRLYREEYHRVLR